MSPQELFKIEKGYHFEITPFVVDKTIEISKLDLVKDLISVAQLPAV